MKRNCIILCSLTTIVALGLLAFTASAQLQPSKSAEKPLAGASMKPSTNSASGKRSPSGHPFHGKLSAIDKSAKTITVGKSVYHFTAETKIKKDGKPATLDDGVIGEPSSGYVKPAADGAMTASSVTFGAKADAKTSKKK